MDMIPIIMALKDNILSFVNETKMGRKKTTIASVQNWSVPTSLFDEGLHLKSFY